MAGYDQFDIIGRLFSADRVNTPAADDDEFPVNRQIGDPFNGTSQSTPVIAVLADGRIVVAWRDEGSTSDGDGEAIRFQILDGRQGQIAGSGHSETLVGSDADAGSRTISCWAAAAMTACSG